MSKKRSPQDMMKIFDRLDVDGNGVVNRAELEQVLSASGVEKSKVKKLMDDLDLNGDGMITRGEYRLALGISGESISAWKELFESMDKDRTGTINKQELMQMFQDMGCTFQKSTLEDWIADHDVNGDGNLSFKEFLGFVAEQAEDG
ncbi:unnamed protein product [Calicophoron daubneyi]|uniref:EF-hand domain-containing protein n=1 Tax=Calicophoron daubneyi TaxID=300641 RepID=A0AAV2TMS6_CALDB